MSYREEKENLGQKWRNSEFRRLFMEMLPKLLLGTVVGVAAVAASTSQVFRKPNIDFNYLYIEEETLHYEVNIDAIDSNIEVESLVIRLEANNDMQEIEGVLGLRSGTFSIVLNRQYNFTIRGDIGFGEQIFYEKKIKAEAKPYVKMNDFSQYGDELLLDFDLFNINQIKDQKITIQILSGLETIYMEDHEAVNGYYLRIPGVKINQTYELRIIANSPKRTTIYEEKLTTNNLPTINIYYGAHGSEVFYELIIEDHFNMLRGDIEVELVSGSKVIKTNTHKQEEMEEPMVYGYFQMDELVQGEFGIVIKGKVGLKEQVLLKETIYIYPFVYLNYEFVDTSIIGSLEIDEYLTDEYQIYAALKDVESEEIMEVLITEELSFEISYDKFRDYYLSLILIRYSNNERYEIFGPIYIKGITPPITGELVINNANISYNPNYREYEIIVEMTNTYPAEYFERYEVEVIDSVIRYDFSYSDTISIPIDSINPLSVIKVYGYKDGVLNNLDERPLDNETVFATVELNGNNNSFDYFVIPYNVDSLDSFELDVVTTDSLGEIYTETLLFEHGHGFGEMSIGNYGYTYVELVSNGVAIGGGTVFILPTVSISCTSLETSFNAIYTFGNTNVTESVRMEVYLNNQLLQTGYTNEMEVLDVIDGSIYEIRLILISDIEYEIIRYQYIYEKPIPPETILVTNGKYFNPTAGNTSYTLLINFSHTYINPETEVVFIIRNNAGEIGRYQIQLLDGSVELEVAQIYSTIDVLITDLNQNIIFEFENIDLVLPPPIEGELVINDSYIVYNNDYKQYEIILDMTSTYPDNHFDSYSFQIIDENLSIIDELTYDYANYMALPLTEEPSLLYQVIVYGHIDRNKHKLAESALNQQLPIGILSLTSGNNWFTFGITLLEPIPDPTATIEILVFDAKGEVISEVVSYDTLDGEILVDNYGNAAIEIYYNGNIIGGGEVFILPTVDIIFSEIDGAFIGSLETNENITEPLKIEAYLNSELVEISNTNEIEILNAVDLGQYQFKVYLTSDVDMLIYTKNYKYINPTLHNTISITNGQYTQIIGTNNYKLKINFTHTFIDQSTKLKFNVDFGVAAIGEYQVALNVGYLEIEVPQEYEVINVSITDLNDNYITTFSKISLIFAPALGELTITDASIIYNNDYKRYEILMQMESTYPSGHFASYSFEMQNENQETLESFNYSYESVIRLPFASLVSVYQVAVYGYINQEAELIASRILDNSEIYAEITLTPLNNLVLYDITLMGTPADPNATYEIVGTDSQNQISSIPLAYDSLMGELPVANYGNTQIELLYNGVAIGGANVFIYPEVYSNYTPKNWSLEWSYDFGHQTVTETTRIEIYHNNELVASSYNSQIVLPYPIDGDTYTYKVIMEDPKRIIYTEELIYDNPYTQDEIYVAGGQYFNPTAGNDDYTLRIYFENTYTDLSTTFFFEVTIEGVTLDPNEALASDTYVEFLVPQIYTNITVTVKDMYGTVILVSENISLTLP